MDKTEFVKNVVDAYTSEFVKDETLEQALAQLKDKGLTDVTQAQDHKLGVRDFSMASKVGKAAFWVQALAKTASKAVDATRELTPEEKLEAEIAAAEAKLKALKAKKDNKDEAA